MCTDCGMLLLQYGPYASFAMDSNSFARFPPDHCCKLLSICARATLYQRNREETSRFDASHSNGNLFQLVPCVFGTWTSGFVVSLQHAPGGVATDARREACKAGYKIIGFLFHEHICQSNEANHCCCSVSKARNRMISQ